jgi:hypothetical protein
MRKLFAPKKNSKILTDSTHPAASESSADKILARRSDHDLAVDPCVPLISGWRIGLLFTWCRDGCLVLQHRKNQ